jgi:hypothetical protein
MDFNILGIVTCLGSFLCEFNAMPVNKANAKPGTAAKPSMQCAFNDLFNFHAAGKIPITKKIVAPDENPAGAPSNEEELEEEHEVICSLQDATAATDPDTEMAQIPGEASCSFPLVVVESSDDETNSSDEEDAMEVSGPNTASNGETQANKRKRKPRRREVHCRKSKKPRTKPLKKKTSAGLEPIVSAESSEPIELKGRRPKKDSEHILKKWFDLKPWLDYDDGVVPPLLRCLSCQKYGLPYIATHPRSKLDKSWIDGWNTENVTLNYQKIKGHDQKDRGTTHLKILEIYLSGEAMTVQQSIEKGKEHDEARVEQHLAKELTATVNMMQLVFLQQQAGLPWQKHPEIVGWFDVLSSADFGESKTHRTRISARAMSIHFSNVLHEELVQAIEQTKKPLSMIIDESTDRSAEPHLVIYIRYFKVRTMLQLIWCRNSPIYIGFRRRMAALPQPFTKSLKLLTRQHWA